MYVPQENKKSQAALSFLFFRPDRIGGAFRRFTLYMKEKRRKPVCGTATALLCLIAGMEIYSLIRVKTAFTDLHTFLLSQHNAHKRLVLDSVLDLEEVMAKGFEHNADAVYTLESGQRSLSAHLRVMERRLAADLADISLSQGALEAAVQAGELRSMAPKDDLLVQHLFSTGKDHFAGERYAQAAVSMADVLSRAPDYHEARLIHAVALFRDNPLDSSSHKEIKADLVSIICRDPHNIPALETLGSVAVEEQDWPAVRQYYRRLIGLDSRNREYYRMFGIACRSDGSREAQEELSLICQSEADPLLCEDARNLPESPEGEDE
jgi:tetratricopeptide (TPR) repeat protein